MFVKQRSGLATFYTIVITQAFSMIGSRMSGLAVGIWLFQETGDVTPLALVAFFGLLPTILGSNVAGLLADRYDRRLIMVLADTGQAICTAALFWLFLTDAFRIEYLYILAFLQGTAEMFQGPAFGASVATLVPDKHRDRANAIQQLMMPAAGLIAPAAASLLYSLVRVEGVILFDLFTFGVAMVVMFFSHIPRPTKTDAGQQSRGSFWKEFTAGFSYLWSYKPMMLLLICACLVNFVMNGLGIMNTPYILLRTDNNEVLLGVLLSVMNAGAIAGGLLIATWGGTRPRIHTVMPAIIGMGLAAGIFGIAQHPVAMGTSMFMIMFCPPLANACLFSILQGKVPPDLQGRVFAAVGQIALLMTPLAYWLVGPLADTVFEPAVGQTGWSTVAPLVGSNAGAGIGLMMVIGGAILAVVCVGFYLLPSVRHFERDVPDYAPVEKPTLIETSLQEAAI